MTEEQLIQLIESHGLGKYRDDILRFTRNAIFMKLQRLTDENDIPIGHTKMGGNPDLPPDFKWYSYKGLPLTFMGQFRLSDLAVYDISHELPQSGILYFFYEVYEQPEGFDQDCKDGHRVLYLPDDTVNLIRHKHPVTDDEYRPINSLPTCKLEFENGLTVPHYDAVTAYLNSKLNERERKQYQKLIKEYGTSYNHHLLGTPNEAQSEMRFECELGSQNIDWNVATQAQRDNILKAGDDWRILFQLDSDDDLEVVWGDIGLVYYWIRKQDLEARNFDDTWAIMQCF